MASRVGLTDLVSQINLAPRYPIGHRILTDWVLGRVNELLQTALKRGMVIHFVNEDLLLATSRDWRTINSYLKFSPYGDSLMPIGLPLSKHGKEIFSRWSDG